MSAKKGLGRGLDALLYDNSVDSAGGGVMMLRLSDIEPNPLQARKEFDQEALRELSESIAMHGIVQPIAVRPKNNGFYEIIAGERRWRAARMAGLAEMPCVIKDVDDRIAAEISLIENLQRENLNPVEEAEGYRSLMQTYELTQEQAAERVGKSRTAVTNILRILKLPQKVRDMVSDGSLSAGHARTLVPLCDGMPDGDIVGAAERVVKERLSVRQTEQLVKLLRSSKPAKAVTTQSPVSAAYYRRLESRAGDSLGRHVSIKRRSDGSGVISLAYSGTDDLESLIRSICGDGFFEADDR